MDEILKVLNVEKYYGNKGSLTKALDNVSFSVGEGEFTGIMGASGSGKTTLLNCIATIDTVTSGNIHIRNKDITAMKSRALAKFRREELGFMFQEYNLLDTLTGFENIILPLTIAGEQHQTAIAKVNQVARRLEIEEIINKYPYEMSGGQRQRIAAARAIVNNPALILADEPTGALDSKSARMLMECLEKLNQDLRATILMVTHDAFTASYCHRILFIKDGKLFNELNRGADSRKEFFRKIIDVVTLLGGDAANVL
ncbi:ABC transporter ATP-binding protein [Dehalobacter sp. TBBPA1]|uniref:ABC transporter ATP-binding protein n=1 Tax=Dehalobacter sp. TBBPA1 TaxID=3235037 RepID=UPI0034A55569